MLKIEFSQTLLLFLHGCANELQDSIGFQF
jgi:hypothetical protein